MKHLEIPNLPDGAYERIERQAQGAGRSVADEVVSILERALGEEESDEEREARIVAEAKANREELARKGVFATEEFIDAAIKWGRE